MSRARAPGMRVPGVSPPPATTRGAAPAFRRGDGPAGSLGQRAAAGPTDLDLLPPLVRTVVWSSGRALDPALRAELEPRLGHDFSAVRVHDDARAAESARDLRALAYTVGDHVVVDPGRSGARATRDLMAHELAHVVQQRRGGGTAPGSGRQDGEGDELERAAGRAASAVADGGRTPVGVSGSAAPRVMRQADPAAPDQEPEEEPAEEPERASQRTREKARAEQRRRERANAGRTPAQLTARDAEAELRSLEASYREPGATARSLKRKEQDLRRYERLLARTRGTTLQKNQRKGAFDELQRTPTTTAGRPQTPYVAGGPQLPGQELRPGRDSYAQPDYSIARRRADGSVERVHVNLKSDKIDTQSVAKARSTARAYLAQAERNRRHLPGGEGIVISFARTPSTQVQAAMRDVLFVKGSPVVELRFGTTTYRLQDHKPSPASPPPTGGGSTQKKEKKKAKAKRRVKRRPRPATAPVKTPPARPSPPVDRRRAPAVPAAAPSSGTPTTSPAGPRTPAASPATARPPTWTATTPTVTDVATRRPAVRPQRPTPVPKASVTRPRISVPVARPRAPTGRGGGLSGMGRAEGAAALAEVILVPIISHYLQKHYAQSIADEAQEQVTQAIEGHRQKYDALIAARMSDVQRVQAEGREVRLHVVVRTNWADTDIGRVATRSAVERYELVFEDGPAPKPYKLPRPGGWFGDIVRDVGGVSFTANTFDFVLEGTDPEVADRRLRRKLIETKLRTGGNTREPFEWLIVQALERDQPLDDLQDFATLRLAQAQAHPSAGPAMAAIAYWTRMSALMNGSLDDLVAAARAKGIPLDGLRLAALLRARAADTDPDVAAYWSEVVRLIDAAPR